MLPIVIFIDDDQPVNGPDNSPDNDEELAATPASVISMLGFDPLASVSKELSQITFGSPDQPRDDHGRWTNGGSTSDVSTIAHIPSIRDAVDRGAWDFQVKGERAPKYGGPGEKTVSYTVAAKDIPKDWQKFSLGQYSTVHDYDPSVTELKENSNGIVFPQLKEGYEQHLPETAGDGIIYRGMSHEEYQTALKTGAFESTGGYNIGDGQKGLTYFSNDPRQSESYANNFAPWQYTATPTRPAVVVAIKDPKDAEHVINENQPSEIGLRGKISTANIDHVYIGHPYLMSSGDVEVRQDYAGNLTEGSRSSPSTSVYWEKQLAPSKSLSQQTQYGQPRKSTSNRKSKEQEEHSEYHQRGMGSYQSEIWISGHPGERPGDRRGITSLERLCEELRFYSPDEVRDSHGRWTNALLDGISSAPTHQQADDLSHADKQAFEAEKVRQMAALQATAKKLKILAPSIAKNKIDYEGGEHVLHFGSDSVTKETLKGEYGITFSKATNFIRFALPNEYLERVKMLNKIFPEQPIEVVGITKRGSIITSTPLVKSGTLKVGPDNEAPGIHPTTEKIAKFLGAKGFKPAGGKLVSEYYNPSSKIRLTDCEPKNFLVDDKGTIHAVDVIPSKVGISNKAGIGSKLFSILHEDLAEFYNPDQPRDAHGRWAGSSSAPAGTSKKQTAIDVLKEKLAVLKAMAKKQAASDAADKKVRDDWFAKRERDLKNQKAKRDAAHALIAHGNAKAIAVAAKAWNDKVAARKEIQDQLKKIKAWNTPINRTAVARGDSKEVKRAADIWNARHKRLSALIHRLEFYSPDQPRDDHGRWGSGGGAQAGPAEDKEWARIEKRIAQSKARRAKIAAIDEKFASGKAAKGSDLSKLRLLYSKGDIVNIPQLYIDPAAIGNSDTANKLAALAMVPNSLHERLAAFGTNIKITDKSVGETPPADQWKFAPRGWPEGSTFKEVQGVYSPSDKLVICGGVGNGRSVEDTMLHELGHAVDDFYKATEYGGGPNGVAGKAYAQFTSKYSENEQKILFGYFTQQKTLDANISEAYAESFKDYHKYGASVCTNTWGKGFTDMHKDAVHLADIAHLGLAPKDEHPERGAWH